MSTTILHYVITHASCRPDSLAALHLLIKSQKYMIFNMIHYFHNSKKKLKINGKNLNIMFCDMMPNDEILETIDPSCNITIIDHHKINKNISKNENINLVHSIDKCGCQLMWEYLYVNMNYPLYIKYIADRDLWTCKLPYTDEINAVFYNKGYTSSIIGIDKLSKIPNGIINNTFTVIGEGIILKENMNIEKTVKYVKFATDKISNKLAVITRCDNYAKTGKILLKKYPDIQYVIIYSYSLMNERLEFGLRSQDGFDVYDLYKNVYKLEGDGYPQACGFTCQPSELNGIIKFNY